MDAIAASINARLRTQPLRHPPHLDPATSHLDLSPPDIGDPSL